jgi:hypothetical protein
MIRSPNLAIEQAAGSERKSGGFGRLTGRQRRPLNALIPREQKLPEGSGDGENGQMSLRAEVQRA